ncbi:MAG: alpha/beta fold hydrolase [Saprospiraceae bacterium]
MAYIQVKDVNIFYTDSGKGPETLVFSHGLLFNTHLFDHQVEALQSRYRCIAYDHPGQGKSGMPTKDFDMEDLYEYAAGLLEALNTGPVYFIGLSMGGFVAMRLAARRPDLVKGIILLDTSAETEPNAFKYSLLNNIVRFFSPKPVAGTILGIMFGKTFLADASRDAEREKWKQHLVQLPKNITRSVNAVIGRKGVLEEIKGIKCPALVVCGEEDVATVPEKSYRIHGQIPGSILKIVPKAGHSSSIEQPEAITTAIQGFIERQNEQ